ncbi:hypothetical protein [Fundidesulfovibrio agrisoli]|uniref:hypothetical protein n=1 Tax=Fundidesulfovibrio agrisoli TaxID=2922717 RepID=UPI001FAE589A|nr:hypothetical protein [Fundidesulfovibrio agrisoli]
MSTDEKVRPGDGLPRGAALRRLAGPMILALLGLFCWGYGWPGHGRELLYQGPGIPASTRLAGGFALETASFPLESLDILRLSVDAPAGSGYAVSWNLPGMGAVKEDPFPPPKGSSGRASRAFLLDCQLCIGMVSAHVELPEGQDAVTLRLERQTRLSLLAESLRIVFPVLAALLLAAFASPRRFLAPALAAMACFAVYSVAAPAPSGAQSGDNRWYLPTAFAMLHGDMSLESYEKRLAGIRAMSVRALPDGRVVNYYPPGLSLALAPIAAWTGVLDAPEALVAEASAKMVAALAVGLFLSICLRLGLGRGTACLTAAGFALCTSQFSVHAGALASHNLACLLSLAMLRLLLEGRDVTVWALALLGVFGVMVRHDMAFMLLGGAASLWLDYRSALVRFACWCALFAAAWLGLNHWMYGALLPPYMLEQGPSGSLAAAPATLLGLLASPNRGLLVYNPVFLPGLCYAFWRVWRPRAASGPGYGDARGAEWGASVALLGFLGALSMFPMWWGGWSYGPRLFGSMYGVLAVLSVLGLRAFLARIPYPRRGMAAAALLLPLLAWGGLANLKGAVVGDSWNETPRDVNTHPERLWDWGDMQALRDSEVLREVLRRALHAD